MRRSQSFARAVDLPDDAQAGRARAVRSSATSYATGGAAQRWHDNLVVLNRQQVGFIAQMIQLSLQPRGERIVSHAALPKVERLSKIFRTSAPIMHTKWLVFRLFVRVVGKHMGLESTACVARNGS